MTEPVASYVLPLYSSEPLTSDVFGGYLTGLTKKLEVIVVDDSPEAIFQAHERTWGRDVRHIKPEARFDFAYRKVTNVTTGVVAASTEKVIVADDDVFYGDAEIEEMLGRLDSADLVVPQNYFDPMPWHARWDSARSLLNRAMWIDFPGTLGLRRSHFIEMGGYDGNLLFENLELIRTVAASGGRIDEAADLYVKRLPPPASHFLSQRVRQAYDDFALPKRFALWLSLAPAIAVALKKRRPGLVLAGAAFAVGVAEKGRRRAGGSAYFPASTSLFAPLWLTERAITSWLAVGARAFLGGVPYARTVLKTSATPVAELRSRFRKGEIRAL